jgi:hypothetical protein
MRFSIFFSFVVTTRELAHSTRIRKTQCVETSEILTLLQLDSKLGIPSYIFLTLYRRAIIFAAFTRCLSYQTLMHRTLAFPSPYCHILIASSLDISAAGQSTSFSVNEKMVHLSPLPRPPRPPPPLQRNNVCVLFMSHERILVYFCGGI